LDEAMRDDLDLRAGGRAATGLRALLLVMPFVLAGLVVGGVVAVMSASIGIASCAPREAFAPIDHGPTCEALVRSLSIRTGAVTGVVTAFFLLLTLALMRTVLRMEQDRGRRALERYREDRS
jgi:hypothetical protein